MLAAEAPRDAALSPFPPGRTLRIVSGALEVHIAPQAGGRLARIVHHGVDWLHGCADDDGAMIGWGCFPMVPWAGRIRGGRFLFGGNAYRVPPNLGPHAIHGVGFALPWRVERQQQNRAVLSLALPRDERWPFGGYARQEIEVDGSRLWMTLSVEAAERAMPCVLGWHPWFPKPERLSFAASLHYPRDAEGIATRPLAPPPIPPWDDCFLNQRPVSMLRAGQRLELTSDCGHWVVYDGHPDLTCVEPQSGPPDAFNLEPFAHALGPGERRAQWMCWRWTAA